MTTGAAPLSYATVMSLHARYLATKTAVLDDTARPVTYAELWEASGRFAAVLGRAGVATGDRVGTTLDPSAAAVAALLGIWRAGAIAAPVNTRSSPREVDEYLDLVAPVLVVTERPHDGLVRAATTLELTRSHVALPLADRLDSNGIDGPSEPVVRVPEGDPAIVFGTGGTTGQPKPAAWTHRGLCLAVASSCAHLAVTARDTELYFSPFFHLTVVTGFLSTLYAGGTVRMLRRLDETLAVDALGTGTITRVYGAPVALDRIRRHPGFAATDTTSVRTLVYGSAPSRPDFVRSLAAGFPSAGLYTGYGATEFGAVTRVYPWEIADEDAGVGRPVTGAEVSVVRADGSLAEPDEPGEVVVRSPWQMAGYLAAGRVAAVGPAAIHSGDIGRIDRAGRLHLAGRLKEMLITGGENVFPIEVEQVLARHPGVAEVGVYGLDDPDWGERVEAAVVAAGTDVTADELRRFCRSQLAGYKIPKTIRFVDHLPYTPNLKLDRRALRAEAADGTP